MKPTFSDVERLIDDGRLQSAKATVDEICGNNKYLAWAKASYYKAINEKLQTQMTLEASWYKKPQSVREAEARRLWHALFKKAEGAV